MNTVVQKYGGSLLADAAHIRQVAQRVVATRRGGTDVVVVVSAMGDQTDKLLSLAEKVAPDRPSREFDMLLTSGERVSTALLAMAISSHGLTARSFTGSQAGILTDSTHGQARILTVSPERIREALREGAVPIVAGFQGMSEETSDPTTLGRGGSDTTAAALAAALEADCCEIYTDVDGVYTADPRLVPHARPVGRISYEEMLELSANGAEVLMLDCVEYAWRNWVPLHVRSCSSTAGTWITGSLSNEERKEEHTVKHRVVTEVTHERSSAGLTVVGVPDKLGQLAAMVEALTAAQITVKMIVQSCAAAPGRLDVFFLLFSQEIEAAVATLEQIRASVGFQSLLRDDDIGTVCLVGGGSCAHPEVLVTLFSALRDAGVYAKVVATSEIRILIVCRTAEVSTAVRAIRDAFEFGMTA